MTPYASSAPAKRCTRVNADSVAFLGCSALSLVARSKRTMGVNPPRRDVVAEFGVELRCVSVLPCDAETCLQTGGPRNAAGELFGASGKTLASRPRSGFALAPLRDALVTRAPHRTVQKVLSKVHLQAPPLRLPRRATADLGR